MYNKYKTKYIYCIILNCIGKTSRDAEDGYSRKGDIFAPKIIKYA